MTNEHDQEAAAYLHEIDTVRAVEAGQKKGWFHRAPVYTDIRHFAPEYRCKQEFGDSFIVRTGMPWWVLAIVFFTITGIGFNILPPEKLWQGLGSFLIFVVLIIVIIRVNRVAGSKSMEIDASGIYLIDYNLLIAWSALIRAEIMSIEEGDDTRHHLLLHFYDAGEQRFRTIDLPPEKMNKEPEKMAYVIRHFSNQPY